MSNGKPYLLGRICEKPEKKTKLLDTYKNDELERMANMLGIKFNKFESNNKLCESIRAVLEGNNINTIDEFDNFALDHKIKKYPSLNDFMIFQPGLYSINKLFNGIDDIGKFNRIIQPIGNNSHNGFIRKFNYVNNGITLDVVLKSNKKKSTDNPYYEYLAGQCINEFSKYFPFFSRTYAIGQYKNRTFWNYFGSINKRTDLPYDISHYIEYFDVAASLDQKVKNSCINSDMKNVFTQFINIKKSLLEYFHNFTDASYHFEVKYQNQLTKHILLLYLVYGTLSKLGNYFTHYDLHMNNVVLYEIPNNNYIDIVIKTINGKKIILKSRYLPIIIDYGRGYFNCHALQSGILDSPSLMKKVCEYDITNPIPADKVCPNICGNEVGYQFSGKINPDGSIDSTGVDDFYINLGKRNISHDLRLLSDLNHIIDFSYLDQDISYIKQFTDLLKEINYRSYNPYGMPETEHPQPPPQPQNSINNIHDAARALDEIVRNPEYIRHINTVVLNSNPDYYGELSIDFSADGFKEFHFFKN